MDAAALALVRLVPWVVAALPLLLALTVQPVWVSMLLLVVAVPLSLVCFTVTSALVARPFRRAIVPGRFRRTKDDPVYKWRRFHALVWTQLYYSPFYAPLLGWAWLRNLVFSLFGYEGSRNVTLYPDVWLRDLPLVGAAQGTYFANRCTLGTNIVRSDRKLLVGPITTGDEAMVGHLSMIALGSTLGDRCELQTHVAMGVRAFAGPRSTVGGCGVLDHMSHVSADARLGQWVYVGTRARVGAATCVPSGLMIAPGTSLRTKQDVDALAVSQKVQLSSLRDRLSRQVLAGE